MSKKIIITIARQYGSAGREIGERIGEILGIPVYDKQIITDAATKGNLNAEVIKNADETAANSLLYTLAMGSNVLGATMHFGYKMPLNDKLFILQSEVIKEYAEAGSCVVIGRCADYVLREESARLSVFIYGDIADRKKRIAERHDMSEDDALDLINKTDRRRASYYNFYTGGKWGRYDNYHLALCSSALGIDTCAEIIAAAARRIMEK